MTDSNLTEQARQGNPAAIATLLNRSFKSQGIQVRVLRRQAQLYIRLLAASPPAQSKVVPRIVTGLQRLKVSTIQTVQIDAQRLDADAQAATPIEWRTRVKLATSLPGSAARAESHKDTSVETAQTNQTNPKESSATNSVETLGQTPSQGSPPVPISSDAESDPSSYILPGWSFWFGWVLMTSIGFTLASLLPWRYLSFSVNWLLTTVIVFVLQTICVGIGQGIVLGQEVSWAKQWIKATILGTVIAGGIQILLLVLLRAVPFIEGLYFAIALLTATPILYYQWQLLRQQLDRQKANLWVGIYGGMTLVIGLAQPLRLLRATPGPGWLNWAMWMISGAVMLHMLRQSRVENLKLNQAMDVLARQNLIEKRRQVNGFLFLEWAGLTFAGSLAGQLATVVLGFLIITIPFSLAIFLTVVAIFQWLALKRRVPDTKNWFRDTAGTAVAGTVLVGGVAFLLGAVGLSMIGQIDSAGALLLSGMGTVFLVIVLVWLAVVAVQGRVLREKGYRASWWLIGHGGIVLLLLEQLDSLQRVGLEMALWPILLPAATIVWILGYPKSLPSVSPLPTE